MINSLERASGFDLCFAGTELPGPYQSLFVQTSRRAERLIPGMSLMYPRVSGHVTAAYLGTLTAEQCLEVERVIQEYSPLLIGQQLFLDGLSLRSTKYTYRAVAEVRASDSWYHFCEETNQALEGIAAKHLFYFAMQPHVTIGKINFKENPVAALFTKFNGHRFQRESNKWKGNFKISDLYMWGINPDDPLRRQIKRVTVPVDQPQKIFMPEKYLIA